MSGHTGTAAQPRLAVLAAGNTGHAVTAYHDLVDMLTGLDRPTGPRTRHARADLAERVPVVIHDRAGGKADHNG